MHISPQNNGTSLTQFIRDIQLPNLNVLAGTKDHVETILNPENTTTYLEANKDKDLYFLGGVTPGIGLKRASDTDIVQKNYFYLDFDIRNWWKENEGEELDDVMVKEVGEGIPHSLNTHFLFRNWRYSVFTGNGIHIYYFGNPVSIRSKEHWKMGMQALLDQVEQVVHMRPDVGCINVGRLARVPGSVNNKGSRPISTEIMAVQEKASVDLSVVEKIGSNIERSQNRPSSHITGDIPEGKRNSTLTSLAGSLRRRAFNEEIILETLQTVNRRQCKPPLPETEVKQIAKSIARYPTAPVASKSASQSVHTPVLVRLSDIAPEAIEWLWSNRIPAGKITLIEGDPGTGKSWCTQAIATAVTLGTSLPGDEAKKRDPASVLLLIAEDGLADTIRPRMEGMGADLSRVEVLTGIRNEKGEERHLSLVDNLASVESVLAGGNYGLVIIDPLNAYLGGGIDTHKDAAMREVFTPLTALAERHGVAILCIRHLTKSARDKAIYRGQGSIAYTAAARVVHLVGANPHNPSERIIACTKINIGEAPPAYAFEITGGRFAWKGETDIGADALLGPETSDEDRSSLAEAQDLLRNVLAGGPRKVIEIEDEATAAFISESTLKRAKSSLGVQARKQGGRDGYWTWELPSKETKGLSGDSWSSLEKEHVEAEKLKDSKGINGSDCTTKSVLSSNSPALPCQ